MIFVKIWIKNLNFIHIIDELFSEICIDRLFNFSGHVPKYLVDHADTTIFYLLSLQHGSFSEENGRLVSKKWKLRLFGNGLYLLKS